MPEGREDEAVAFYAGVLGLEEAPKPPELAGRGGRWFRSGPVEVHLGVEERFVPATKAHPALLVDDLASGSARPGSMPRPTSSWKGTGACTSMTRSATGWS